MTKLNFNIIVWIVEKGNKSLSGQYASEIAKNLAYVEDLASQLIKLHGERLCEMYRNMKRREIAEALLPDVNVHAARSALRIALNQLLTHDERMEIARVRWSETGKKYKRIFTEEDRAKANANRITTDLDVKRLVESREDALWTSREDEELVRMMRANNDWEDIARRVTDVQGHERTIVACKARWQNIDFIPKEEKEAIARNRQRSRPRRYTDEQRAEVRLFSHEDRLKALEASGQIAWLPEEDALLKKMREEGYAFRVIAEKIMAEFGHERTTAACTGRYHNKIHLRA